MRSMTEKELTDIVLQRYAGTPDPRLRDILQSLIKHLHAFARDVRLTEDEWMAGVEFLTATGKMCDDKRQEMILLSDNLGLSSLINMISAGTPEGATESTVLGPFYVPGTPECGWGESVLRRPAKSDEPTLFIHGHVRGPGGKPVPHATIEVWQTDSNGMYDIQDTDQPVDNLRGLYTADDKGEFLIRTIRPASYPIPTDGPVGILVRATQRSPWRPAHVHAMVKAAGHNTLTTHLFDVEDPYLDSDVVFAVKNSLIRKFDLNDSPERAEKFGATEPFYYLENDFILAAGA